jgi:hypothetical protein
MSRRWDCGSIEQVARLREHHNAGANGVGARTGPLNSFHGQLWLWFWGMLITTIPWHIAGLMGQPRRVAIFDYSLPFVARMAPLVIISVIGGLVLLTSAILLITVLVRSQLGESSLTETAALCAGGEPAAGSAVVLQRFRSAERHPCMLTRWYKNQSWWCGRPVHPWEKNLV